MSFIFGYFLCPNNADLMATILPNDVNDRSNDLISSYLTDAGGMALDSHIDFLEFAVRKLENPSISLCSISSNSYGVDILNDKVHVYFFYDEIKECLIERSRLLKIMQLWIGFLKKRTF